VIELSSKQAREKCHQALVAGLRLIRPEERVTAIAAALQEVEARKNNSTPRWLGNDSPPPGAGPARAYPAHSIRLLLVEIELALYCQHVPSRRHFLKFLFMARIHQALGKFPAFFGVPVVFQYSLHDAIPQSIKSTG